MSIIIQPIFETRPERFMRSTQSRYSTMFLPIQAHNYYINGKIIKKESDLTAFLLTPLIDAALEPMLALDVLIHLFNAQMALYKAIYLWSSNQKDSKSLIDQESWGELQSSMSSMQLALGMAVAGCMNSIYSSLSLVTRPIASAVKFAVDVMETNLYAQLTANL